MQQEDIDIISFLGALIWSNNVIKKKVFYETYGKILETKIAEIIEFERRLEIISKECGIKIQKVPCSKMKKLLNKLHKFKIDSLSDDEEEITPKIVRCIRSVSSNYFFNNNFQLINQTLLPNELDFKTPISSKCDRKKQIFFNNDEKTEITINSSSKNSTHSDEINNQSSFNEYNNNDKTFLNNTKSLLIQETINDKPDISYSAKIDDFNKDENLINIKNQLNCNTFVLSTESDSSNLINIKNELNCNTFVSPAESDSSNLINIKNQSNCNTVVSPAESDSSNLINIKNQSNCNTVVSPAESDSCNLIRPIFCALPAQYHPLPISLSNYNSEESFKNDSYDTDNPLNVANNSLTQSTSTSRKTFVVIKSTDETNKLNENVTIFNDKNESLNNINLNDLSEDEKKQFTPCKNNQNIKFLENELNSSNIHLPLNERVAQALSTPSEKNTFIPFLTCSSSNYDIDNLEYDDETDFSEYPRKPIPNWANESNLSISIKNQRLNLNNKRIHRYFGHFEKPHMDEIFANYPNSNRYNLNEDKNLE